MALQADFEFSWKDNLLYGQYIVPAVRNQGHTSTCIFQSLCAAGDMEKLNTAARMNPSHTTDIRFSASRFAADYKAMAGPVLLDSDHKRFNKALEFFQQQGVYAEGGGVSPRRYKIASSQEYEDATFDHIVEIISHGKPVIGGIRIDDSFRTLKPGDIYDYTAKDRKTTDEGKAINHAVVFIGFGQRDGRAYLVILNSHGTTFGDKDFGRVYFEHARYFTTIEF